MSIYIVTHKKTELPHMERYLPIQVGAALHEDLGYLKDDCGDNISKKNPSFCELTALYALWKNVKEQDIIGMVHYRRYFFRTKYSVKYDNILSFDECKKILSEYDVILPQKHYFKTTVRQQYTNIHELTDLEKCRDIILKEFPEYIQAFDQVLSRKYVYPYNMFVMNKKLFDEYMEWLFIILFQLEKMVDIKNYNEYNQRIYGFLAERLFNVWILKKNLKIKQYPVFNIEETRKQRIGNLLKNDMKKLIDNIATREA